MFVRQHIHTAPFVTELRALFYQRTLVCLWLGVVFFSLFALLDYFCCREQFLLFFLYRLVYVLTLLSFINLLAMPAGRKYAPLLISLAMLLGGFSISLMTVRLGGFSSGYYVGILLMIAGALSVLPLNMGQALLIGLGMYLVYVVTVLVGTNDFSAPHLVLLVNNSFFFLSLVLITMVQSFDDLQTLLKSLRAKMNVMAIRKKLTTYTDGLEEMVQERLAALEESHLKYRELYDSMLDMVVLLDDRGIIWKSSRHCEVLLGYAQAELEGRPFCAFKIADGADAPLLDLLLEDLDRDKRLEGLQLQLRSRSGVPVEVELSGSQVVMEEGRYGQLILRDITATKLMERQIFESERLIDTSRQAAIFGLARLAECRDDDTGAHLNRIRSYTSLLVDNLADWPAFAGRISREFREDIFRSSVLHDIGKVGIPDSILLKPGRLTKEEFEVMKKHSVYGSDILAGTGKNEEGVTFLMLAREIARHHHERWDGNGYPDGLAGEAIPLAARIVALADVYDALTSTRVYKAAYSHDEARRLITNERGGQFDPQVVDAFVRLEPAFKECRMQFLLQESRKAA